MKAPRRALTFTDTELLALDLCLNVAGNAEAWSDSQTNVDLVHAMASASLKIRAAR